MIHNIRIGSKARGGENESTSVCVFCMLLGYAIKTVKRLQELSIPSFVTFITLLLRIINKSIFTAVV